jgi:hypothetical protein
MGNNDYNIAVVDGVRRLLKSQHEASDKVKEDRPYMGISSLGDECRRRIWYKFKGAPAEPFDVRRVSIFETGDLWEERIVKRLRSSGFLVSDRRPEDPDKQWAVFDEVEPQIKGHLDAVMAMDESGPVVLLEIKSMGSKYYTRFKGSSLYTSHPDYYTQVQLYMLLSRSCFDFSIADCVVVAVNKDTDEIHAEIIPLHEQHAKSHLDRARALLKYKTAPSRLSEDPCWWQCKGCQFRKHCFELTA